MSTVPIKQLLALGFSLFPLFDKSKIPALAWKQYQTVAATRDQMVTWWKQGYRNFGIACGKVSGIVVIDTDTDASESWAAQHLPATPLIVRSGSGRGRHRYYRWLADLPANIHPDGLTIELKRDGLFVVAPGSIHPCGDPYTVEGSIPSSIVDLPFFDPSVIPQADLVAAEARAAGEPFEFPDVVTQGERRSMLYRLVRQFKGWGSDIDMARQVVLEANVNRCDPPLTWTDEPFETWFARAWNQPDRPLTDRVALPVEQPTLDLSDPTLEVL